MDLRWKGGDYTVVGPWGPVIAKPNGDFRPLRAVVGRQVQPGMVVLRLVCGHEVTRYGSPVSKARCEHCFEQSRGT